ncbi:MAG: MBL fold metallo-hydrolase [Sneathiella sp.]|nr:MBL fold metallo-hydrolase [Sneathiella sp.]
MKKIVGIWIVGISLIVVGCEDQGGHDPISENSQQRANEKLTAHTQEFNPAVIQVTENVHVAVGYGLANSILIEGDKGVIIVDTTESVAVATAVKREFDKITSKPVRAIIYTHNHADHILGSGVFAGNDNPDIYSYETTPHYMDKILQVIRPVIYKRAMRQFGSLLPKDEIINDGIGPFLDSGPSTPVDLMRPTKTFSGDKTSLTIEGVNIELHFAPGETPDQIFVWLPDQKLLMPGDNFYKSFPNLYAIRGTSYRDVMDWVSSLDKMRELRPEYLVPSHTRPLKGSDEIYGHLTDYRDAIQFVHDQTVRGMNMGLTVQQITEKVQLPQHLAESPYLQEFYGRVDWSVRSIFTGYLGWFDGNATNLKPLAEREQAKRMIDLVGSADILRQKSQQALQTGDYQWALQLADTLLVMDKVDEVAVGIRLKSLKALADREISANGRNYYLTQAAEMEALKITEPDTTLVPERMLRAFPIAQYMKAMPANLDAAKAADTEVTIGFEFTDTNEVFTIEVRRGIAEVTQKAAINPQALIRTDTYVWKEILAKRRNPALAFASGDVEVEGSVLELLSFLSLFQPQDNS